MRIICQFSEGRDWMSSYTLYIQRRFHTSTTLVIIPYSRFASVKYPISPTLSTLLPYSFCRLLHPTKSSLRCVGGIFLLRSLVGAKPLHLACARPFGRLKAPLGLSLLRFANAVPPQTLPGTNTANGKLPLSFNDSSTDQNGRKNSSEKQKGDPNWAEHP